MIEIQNLTKKYGDVVAVQDLNFQVEKGTIWGLLGPNAAGKTTTMRILTGYHPATDGNVRVGGYSVFEDPNEVKKLTGYLPEIIPLYPDMTVQSFLNFTAEIKQIPSSQKKEAVDKAVEVSDLGPVRKRLIKNISRGFKQRVGIAQALIHNPQVLVLDEPTIGLDPAQIIEIRNLIKSLKGEHTILLSTHILAEVTQVCDGVVIINEGQLMASGSLEELTSSYTEKEGVFVRLKQRNKETQTLLENFQGVEKVTPEDHGYRVEWSKGKDLRSELNKLIVEKDLGLLEMKPLTMNLEDIYLKVISGGMEQ
ncbi:ABC transporter ATP-binding protein [bacterium]|nr:ABC transporter ATP-binding protein [bacterium]